MSPSKTPEICNASRSVAAFTVVSVQHLPVARWACEVYSGERHSPDESLQSARLAPIVDALLGWVGRTPAGQAQGEWLRHRPHLPLGTQV